MSWNHFNIRNVRPHCVCVYSLEKSMLPFAIFSVMYFPNIIPTPAAWSGCREHKVFTLTQTAVKKWSEWTTANPPNADARPFKAGALEMPISSAAQRRSFPFSVLLLSSSIVSLWGSLFRGIHASAFRPQWPPLYKLSACLPQAFGSCFLSLINLEEFINFFNGKCRHKIRDGPPSSFCFFLLFFTSEGRHSGYFCPSSLAAWTGLKLLNNANFKAGICEKGWFKQVLFFSVFKRETRESLIPAKIRLPDHITSLMPLFQRHIIFISTLIPHQQYDNMTMEIELHRCFLFFYVSLEYSKHTVV